MTNESRARSFGAAAARYAAHRPSYPPELLLRPGGALAVWSNDPDVTVGWIADQQARIEERFGPGRYINERTRSQHGARFAHRRLP
ncbi:hypothetical protein ACFCV9_36370 [Streptomyces sp. NPDC056367]|uniref:hypothetical protein n=1 Tax=unclassified Streptomyces TaxID=2593676 RepID=UPI0035E01819